MRFPPDPAAGAAFGLSQACMRGMMVPTWSGKEHDNIGCRIMCNFATAEWICPTFGLAWRRDWPAQLNLAASILHEVFAAELASTRPAGSELDSLHPVARLMASDFVEDVVLHFPLFDWSLPSRQVWEWLRDRRRTVARAASRLGEFYGQLRRVTNWGVAP